MCEWLALAVKEIFVTFDFIRFAISLDAVHNMCPLTETIISFGIMTSRADA